MTQLIPRVSLVLGCCVPVPALGSISCTPGFLLHSWWRRIGRPSGPWRTLPPRRPSTRIRPRLPPARQRPLWTGYSSAGAGGLVRYCCYLRHKGWFWPFVRSWGLYEPVARAETPWGHWRERNSGSSACRDRAASEEREESTLSGINYCRFPSSEEWI